MKTSAANGLTPEVKEMLSLAILGFHSSSKLSITAQPHVFPKEKVTTSLMPAAPSKQRSGAFVRPKLGFPALRLDRDPEENLGTF